MSGKFIISLDFELHWGAAEKWDVDEMRTYFLNTVKYIPELLLTFQEYNIRCTWATVGFLFAKNKKQLTDFSPKVKPTYDRRELSYYNIIPQLGNDETDDPFHYGPSLIQQILNTPGQELASHTFAHYYCNELGQTVEQFDADLKAAQIIAKENFGVRLQSLVFPRNQFNKEYLQVAKKNGIKVVRSNPNVWFWNWNFGKFKPLFRALDTLIPISNSLCFLKPTKDEDLLCLPASRFFRPFNPREKSIQRIKLNRIKREMTYAAKHNRIYHLWWHPHNFGDDIESNRAQLIEILSHFKELEYKYKFTSSNMGDYAMV
ncbi:polysaccharide deacetylase family protein [Arenibacter amylolyticus]|uniref:polysaccharide deacetylase family protein n=1 Tax=Arenibacter amylolyticus TaxID=1406873 RepID=UPI000A3648E7|nr:polysaccharide deacetylase family protein [Arenibacter amylolyticus]